ncbi:MAG: hypothetical protein RSG53_06785 [Oscillospiraceae bacterium]
MSISCEAAVVAFTCPANTVWQALTDASTYDKWYGFPNPRSLVKVDPEFSLGAKLTFENILGSTIITVFEPIHAITLSTGINSDEFTITESEHGCRVSLVTALNGSLGWNGTDKAKSRTNKEILRQLRSLICNDDTSFEAEQLVQPVPEKERGMLANIFSSMFYGYKNPLKLKRTTAIGDSLSLSTIIDNTEGDIIIHLRAMIVGIFLMLTLFAALFMCGNFESSEIVTSSGLSVVESEKVDKQGALGIYIGQSRTELELMLSCRGTRISSSEYVYYSIDRNSDGENLKQIYVTFDAYGGVRRFGYLDLVRCRDILPVAVKDYGLVLNPAMSISDIEKSIGAQLSAFWCDKSGLTIIHFGTLDVSRSIFDPTLTSELVVKQSKTSPVVLTQFYNRFDPLNTLPIYTLNKQYKRQYNNVTYYLADRAAFERIFIIVGKTREQVDAILGTEGVNYAATYNDGILCSYSCRSTVLDEAAYRYCYNVTFYTDDIAAEVSMQNGYLENRSDTLLDYSSYSIHEGTTLYELYSTMGLLPTYSVFNGQTLTLCYGQRHDGHGSTPYLYNLTVKLDAATLTVVDYSFNY